MAINSEEADNLDPETRQLIGIAEDIKAAMSTAQADQFDAASQSRIERLGIRSPEYVDWLTNEYARRLKHASIPRENSGMRGPHYQTGSTRKAGSHGSSRHH